MQANLPFGGRPMVIQRLYVQQMLLVVVMVGRADAVQDFGFVLRDFAHFNLLHVNLHGQADALRQFGCRLLWFGRRGFGGNVQIAQRQFLHQQVPLPQGLRLPCQFHAAEFQIRAFGLHADLVGGKAVPHAAGERFGFNLHIGKTRHLLQCEAQTVGGGQ